MQCVSNISIATKQRHFLLSSQMFQMNGAHIKSSADMMMKTPDDTISQVPSSSCRTNLKLKIPSCDDNPFFCGLESSSSTPDLILDDIFEPIPILEPTPFKEGASLQLADSSEKDFPTPDRKTMFKLSEQDPDISRHYVMSCIEKSLGAENNPPSSLGRSKNLKRPLPSSLAQANAGGSPKRPHTVFDSDMSNAPQLRPHQDVLWQEHFSALIKFIKEHGHCHVHYTCGHNPALSKWVQRQRYQYKLKIAGKKTTLTRERQQKLEAVGFVWDSHAATWQQRLNELANYKKEHGDCTVPSTYPPNPQLAMWVKSQRRQFKLYREGLNSNLSEERLKSLSDLGFTWELRSVNEVCGGYA